MSHLVSLLQDGKIRVPLSAFAGRTTEDPKTLYGDQSKAAQEQEPPGDEGAKVEEHPAGKGAKSALIEKEATTGKTSEVTRGVGEV